MLVEKCQRRAGTTPNSVPSPGPNATPPAIGIQPGQEAALGSLSLTLVQIHKGVILRCACGADLGGCDCHKGRGTPERIAWLQARRADLLAARGGVA